MVNKTIKSDVSDETNSKEIPRVNKELKAEIFLALKEKPIVEVGKQYGFDKRYPKKSSLVSFVYNIYNTVRKDPEKFGLLQKTVDEIVDKVSGRNAGISTTASSLRKININDEFYLADLEKKDIKELTLSNRDKVARLLRRKLDSLGNKEIKEMKLSEFVNIYGMLFDKGQILQGQATENIAVLSKIEDGLSSKELLDALLQQRESTVSDKE